MVEIFAIKIIPENSFPAYTETLLDTLPEESRVSVKKFRKAVDFQRSLLGESLTRTRLSAVTGIEPSQLVIRRSAKGKPELVAPQDIHFNISHSGDWVVTALSDREVGIDVELIREPQYRIAERFFSGVEREALTSLYGEARMNYFFDLWTLKESYLKLLGKGLTQSLGSFTLKQEGKEFRLVVSGTEIDDIHFRQFPLDPAYTLSVCSRSEEFKGRVNQITVQELVRQIKNEYDN